MANRLTKIVTRTGDGGNTGMADGSRRSKNDIRVHCLGEVDELNAVIGLCASLIKSPGIGSLLESIQHDLFDLGAELCQPGVCIISDQHVQNIAEQAEAMNASLPPLKEFILPGGSVELAQLHLARTVCRRAERNLVHLHEVEPGNPLALAYLNRLSDLMFIVARFHASESGQAEVYWQSGLSRVKQQDAS